MKPLHQCAICGAVATENKIRFSLNEGEQHSGKINVGIINAELKKSTYLSQCPKCRRYYCNKHQKELVGQNCNQCKDSE